MPRRRSVLGVIALVVAIGLGAAGAWLIVTGDTKQTKIGVLLGLWGLLLGAYQIVGSRHAAEPVVPPAPEATTDLATREDAEAMRRYEQRLEAMLRRQIEMMSAEMATMRAELVTLRSELVEKVGGQLRLERTETTRLIGSDIGALQNEVRQLMRVAGIEEPARAVLTAAPPEVVDAPPADAPAPVSPWERPTPIVVAPTAAPAESPAPTPTPAAAAAAAAQKPATPEPTRAPAPEPAPVVAPTPRPADPIPAPAVATAPPSAPAPRPAEPTPAKSGDPFASLPRLTPFHDDAPTARPADAAAAAHLAPAPGAFDAALGLTPPRAGRHAQTPAGESTGRGRRRRDDSDDDGGVLARILAREGTSRD